MHALVAATGPERLGVLRDAFDLPDAPAVRGLDDARSGVAVHRPAVVVADAVLPWLRAWLAELGDPSAPATVVVADAGSVSLLAPLARAGADAVVALPASRGVTTAALECAAGARRRATDTVTSLVEARRRLQHLVDLGCDLERERRRGDILATAVVRLERAFADTCRTVASVASTRGHDRYAGERVASLATMLAAVVAPDLAREPHLALGFLLHDVGEIAIPDHVLLKPGELSTAERSVLVNHPALGAEIVGRADLLRPVVPIIRHHHERWDGTGYPDRLAGTDIPVGARVFAVADAADAMLTDRPYRAALSLGEVCLELERAAGSQFDPDAVSGFLGLAETGALELSIAS